MAAVPPHRRSATALLIIAAAALSLACLPASATNARTHARNMYAQSLALVKPAPLLLPYHNGPVLSGPEIRLHLIWYGSFTPSQKSIVVDFLDSFAAKSFAAANSSHTVSAWWSTTAGYIDAKGHGVTHSVVLGRQSDDARCSLGKTLKPSDIESLVLDRISSGEFPSSASSALYVVLTAADVYVDGFCLNSCGFHAYTFPGPRSSDKMLPYAWVGNAATQCAGQCAWPFAVADYGPKTPPLRPPSGDVGMEGIVINLATLLAGAATNPFGTGFFQGDSSAPLEAASACTGIFGRGAFPGYPGELLTHSPSGSSYNAEGVRSRRFLLPSLWHPTTLSCRTL